MRRAPPTVGRQHVDRVGAGELLAQRRDLADRGGGQRQVGDRDDAVRARGVRPDRAVLGDVQPHAGAPAGAVGRARQRLDLDRALEARHALQRLGEHLRLQLALVAELDVPELGAARAIVGVAVHGRPRPRRAAWRCGLGSSTRTVSARQKLGLASSVIRATTLSPGIASDTKTTRPSSRATEMPPCAILVASSSTSRPACHPSLRA